VNVAAGRRDEPGRVLKLRLGLQKGVDVADETGHSAGVKPPGPKAMSSHRSPKRFAPAVTQMAGGRPLSNPMPDPQPRKTRSLALWLTLSVGVFVLACSLALLAVFNHRVAREESAEFEALARTNAAFLNRTPLPHSDKMAAQLGEVMGARVFFVQDGLLIGRPGDNGDVSLRAIPPDGRVHPLAGGLLVVGHPLRQGARVVFVRQAGEAANTTSLAMLERSDTWGTLGVFWLLSFVLAWWLSRRVARPLRDLASAVHEVGGDEPLRALPVERADEIGLLARALADTHASLLEERERRRAAERLALLGRMATGLAHEVRNPVSAIRLHAQLLEDAPEEEAAASIALIESEAARIEALVSQWMRYAKPAPPVMTGVSVPELVRQAIQTMEPQARHAGVAIQSPDPLLPEPPMIQADRSRLQQVLLNLLLNAIQAMPRGGTVSVQIEVGEAGLSIAVEDQGQGFSDTALARYGEPFFSEKEGGMGLGLAVSQELCRAHGGDLRVKNRAEGGARVAIFLPTG